MPDWYKKNGQPYRVNRLDIGDEEYMKAMEEVGKDLADWDKKRVDRTRLWWGGVVSTVWLGLNHNWGDGPPLIFETMVFSRVGGWSDDLYIERYSTIRQARDGHNRIVKKYRSPKFAIHGWILRITSLFV